MTLEEYLNRNRRVRLALYACAFASALIGSFVADGWPSALCVFGILAVFTLNVNAHNEKLSVMHARLNQLWRAAMERS